jgi:hypothetical protein
MGGARGLIEVGLQTAALIRSENNEKYAKS